MIILLISWRPFRISRSKKCFKDESCTSAQILLWGDTIKRETIFFQPNHCYHDECRTALILQTIILKTLCPEIYRDSRQGDIFLPQDISGFVLRGLMILPNSHIFFTFNKIWYTITQGFKNIFVIPIWKKILLHV